MTAVLFHDCFYAMGTRFDAVLADVDEARGRGLVREAALRVEEMEEALSVHRTGSAASWLNRRLETQADAAIDDPQLFGALSVAEHARAATGGLFTPTARVGAPAPGFQVDREAWRVEVEAPGARFDFGGLGKGLALDVVEPMLVAAGVASAFLSFGESSIRAVGRHPLGPHWPVSLRHPMAGERELTSFALTDACLSVSCTVRNGREGGAVHAHVIRASSGAPVAGAKTVCAVTQTAAMGEAISTALLAAHEHEALAVTKAPGMIEEIAEWRVFSFDDDMPVRPAMEPQHAD
ncbi:MAG: FAD:protein FMN transferase [Caulobacterales bacterium]|nr:FAD:protein FMN transferase [Caulobacterales bacterium]